MYNRPHRVAFLLGLTGNIACGKSSVGRLLAERFGGDLLSADGTIDRRRLGDRVLADPGALKDLEAILHPGVRRAINQRIESSTADVVVLDAIRLIEAGL